MNDNDILHISITLPTLSECKRICFTIDRGTETGEWVNNAYMRYTETSTMDHALQR